METFSPKGNICGPILPEFILKKKITPGAKLLYALLCSHASKHDHCWPSHRKLAAEFSSSVSSVKRYLAELVSEKLVVVCQEQYSSCSYYMVRPDGLRELKTAPDTLKVDCGQPKVDCPQVNLSYINNLKKQEENTNPPLPPVRDNSTPSPAPRHRSGGGVISFAHDFEKAWEAYPKKEAMGLARSAWVRLHRSNLLPPLETILSSIRRFAGTEGWQRNQGQFIPQMGNFLRGQRWLDPLSPEEEQHSQYREAIQAIERQQKVLEDAKEVESDRLRPLFEALAEKFKATWNPNIYAMAFGTWRHLRSKGQAPSPSDVPDSNTLDIMAFMKAFQRKCEERAYNSHAYVSAFKPEAPHIPESNSASRATAMRASDLLARFTPQREALCAAV